MRFDFCLELAEGGGRNNQKQGWGWDGMGDSFDEYSSGGGACSVFFFWFFSLMSFFEFRELF